MNTGSAAAPEATNPWGVEPPSPVTESKFFNAARRTITLLVEGGFDRRFWRMHTHRDCRVESKGGRPKVLDLLDQAAKHADAVLLGVLDADLDRLEDRLVARNDVVWTDAHDLEGTLLALPAFEKLLDQLIDPEKRTEDEARWAESVRARLLRHAIEIGVLRRLAQREDGVPLVFKKLSKKGLKLFDRYKDCVDADWSPSLAKIIPALINYSSAHQLVAQDLVDQRAALPTLDPTQLCNGHDLVGFLLVWQRIALPSADELADRLAVACERRWLTTTSMWQGIEAWEQAHPGFRVLKSESEHDGAS